MRRPGAAAMRRSAGGSLARLLSSCRGAAGERAYVKPALQHESLAAEQRLPARDKYSDDDAAALRRWHEMQSAGSPVAREGTLTPRAEGPDTAVPARLVHALPSAEETRERLRSHAAASCSGTAAGAGVARPSGMDAGAQQEAAPALDWRDVAAMLRTAPAALQPAGADVLTDTFG